MKRSRAIGLGTAALLCPAPAFSQEAINAEDRADLIQLVAGASQAPETVGFSVAVARGGTVAFSAARGERNLDPKAPATVETWYCIGSVTKQFTAALIMQLVEARRLALDDKLATVLPEFPHASDVTFRQLLNHTSGLAEYSGQVFSAGLLDKAGVRPDALVALIAGKPLDFVPGTKWEYSNSNYVALGLTIEKIAGKPYAHVLRERIIQPLGIAVYPGPPPSGEIARGYTAGTTPMPMAPSDISWAYAAGEIYATVGGLVAWDRALFGGRVVNAESLAQMTTPAKLVDGTSTDYGFGFSAITVLGHRMISHNGGVPGGFAAQNFVFPDDGIAIVTLANTMNFNLALPATKLADVFLPGTNAALESLSQERVTELDDPTIRARAREWIGRIETGSYDTSQLTPQMASALTPDAVKPALQIIKPAGAIENLRLAGFVLRGGYRIYVYTVTAAAATYTFTFVLDPQDKVAGLFFKP
ncbi:MAG TPA: serine hydrolase domain-containing protein [Candidatus Acidoferrales bacterium]|nr:serine hydrolase domain-containing protein [Candidatus Acidoferrales bacterium]